MRRDAGWRFDNLIQWIFSVGAGGDFPLHRPACVEKFYIAARCERLPIDIQALDPTGRARGFLLRHMESNVTAVLSCGLRVLLIGEGEWRYGRP